MLPITPTAPPLAELVALQQAHPLFAFTWGEEDRIISRLQAIYAKKLTQLSTYEDLITETSPDLILRAADGREILLRLPSDEAHGLYGAIRQVLENELRKMEERILRGTLELEANEFAKPDSTDVRLAILTLCQPGSATASPPAEPGAGRTHAFGTEPAASKANLTAAA
jgi:hypothetical protein